MLTTDIRGTTSAGFDDGNLMLALRNGKNTANKFKVTKAAPSTPTNGATTVRPPSGAKLREGSRAENAAVAAAESKTNVTAGDASSASVRRSGKRRKDVAGQDGDARGEGKRVPGGVILEGDGSGAYDARFRTVSALLQECLAFNYTTGADT